MVPSFFCGKCLLALEEERIFTGDNCYGLCAGSLSDVHAYHKGSCDALYRFKLEFVSAEIPLCSLQCLVVVALHWS